MGRYLTQSAYPELADLNPLDLFSDLLGARVLVKAQDKVQLKGRLIHVDRSQGHNGGFGNLILEDVKGPVLVKGAMVQVVLKR